MTRYLVAADADQIQNLLFRSSHLREVIGGSMYLSEFCKKGTQTALIKTGAASHADVIIDDGGSFRLKFDSPEKVEDFLEYLRDLFREKTGGTLTVAGPIKYEDGEFQANNEKLQLELLNSKYCREGADAERQLPVSAFCASCGIELATDYATPTPELPKDERIQTYLCSNCQNKTKARQEQKHPFFERYLLAIREAIQDWEKKHNRKIEQSFNHPLDPAELIGSLDATQYVGYVLADVNGMGKRFNECKSPEELTKLSNDLTNALWASLAAPIPDLIDRLKERNNLKDLENRMPIVPLILGGDDLLALVPARYALDIGCRIGQAFEEEAKQRALNVTIGVAVVICQNHYPYTLAYERGSELLQQAKKHGKSQKLSALNFEVILGNELKPSIAGKTKKKQDFRSTLKPYWISSNAPKKKSIGSHLETLLEQRLQLTGIPQKRLHELRQLFDQKYLDDTINHDQTKLHEWLKELKEKCRRIGSIKLNDALEALGDDSKEIWRSVSRLPKEPGYSAHGVLDLIEAWDYAYKLDKEDKDYRPEES